MPGRYQISGTGFQPVEAQTEAYGKLKKPPLPQFVILSEAKNLVFSYR